MTVPRQPPEVYRRRRLTIGAVAIALVALVVVAVVALGGSDGSTSAKTVGATGPTEDTPVEATPAGETGGEAGTTSTTAAKGELKPGEASGEAVTLAFAGDVNFQSGASDPAARIAPYKDVLSSADVAMVNLETAIATGGTPVAKQFTFRAPPSVLGGLAADGVDVVTMANNHGMDYGSEGLQESLAAKKDSPVAIVGIGANEDEAFAPHVVEVKGQRIAFIGATQVLDSNVISAWTATPTQGGLASAKRVDRLVAEVQKARKEADTVVVDLHWGVEKMTCPTQDQQDLAKALVDAGADVVIGSHNHRVVGGGRMGDAVVNYGLGNFGFPAQSSASADTGVFRVVVRGRHIDSYEWLPGRINGSTPVPLSGSAAAQASAAWEQLRPCTNLST